MLAFGLNKKLCNDFLKKQAVIGNLDEGEWRQGQGFGGECAACWNPHPAQRTVPAVIYQRPACAGHSSFPLETQFC